MDTSKIYFLQNQFTLLLKNVSATKMGKWGKMNAQQMVEHLANVFAMSFNKIRFPIVTPAEHLLKAKAFLYSDKVFKENTKAPLSVLGDEPMPLQHQKMQEAIMQLQKNIDGFVNYFKENSSNTAVHPVFGELNFEEWVLFHHKHIMHHGTQFEVV